MSNISLKLQREIVRQSKSRCAYCQSQQQLMGVSLTIDHVMPQSLGGTNDLESLCLACWDCNLIKNDRITAVDPQTGDVVRLFHPNQQQWDEHFSWSESATHLLGQTATGRATIIALQLNRPQLLESRRYWVQAGWHPPV